MRIGTGPAGLQCQTCPGFLPFGLLSPNSMLVCPGFGNLENELLQWLVLWSCQYAASHLWPRSHFLDIKCQSSLVLAGAGYGSPLAPARHLYNHLYRRTAGNSARTL